MLKIKVSEDGKIYTFDHNVIIKNGRLDDRKGKQLKPGIDKYSSVREASRKTGICQWTIRKYGREVMPNE